jgi:arylsulfatase A-like enzyme
MHFEPVYADHGFDTMRMCEDLFPSGGYAVGTADDYAATLSERGVPDWRPELRDRAPDEPPAPVGLLGTFPYGEELHPTGWVRDQAIEVLRARDRRRPLFLVVSFPSPHPPYNPPEPWASRYDPEEIEVPTDGFEVNESLPPSFRRALDAGPQRVGTARQTKRILTAVRALVRQLDDAIAAVLTEIDLQRTSIFFTSDHGDYAGHRGLLMKRPWIPFDDLARVPFLAAGAGVVGARRLDGLVSTLDLAPTFLDLAGVEVPHGLDGVSQASVLREAGAVADPDRTIRCATSQHWPMARRGPLKFIFDRWTHEQVVFEMEGDPGETVNRAGDMTLGEAGVALMEGMAGFSDEPSTLTADGPAG